MKILYIPYSKENAGDLSALVESWKANHGKNHKEAMRIIYHNDPIALDQLIGTLEVFICFHSDHSRPIVSNHANFQAATTINIKTVAERFNQDFLPISHAMSAIHIYCCGRQGKNRALAFEFQNHLLRPEACSILYYNGRVYPADADGQMYCSIKNRVLPLHRTRRQISAQNFLINEEDRHLSIKEQYTQKRLKHFEERKRSDFSFFQKTHRQDTVKALRQRSHSRNTAAPLNNAIQ